MEPRPNASQADPIEPLGPGPMSGSAHVTEPLQIPAQPTLPLFSPAAPVAAASFHGASPVAPEATAAPWPIAANPIAVPVRQRSPFVGFLLAFFFGVFSLFYVHAALGAVALILTVWAFPMSLLFGFLLWPVMWVVTPVLVSWRNRHDLRRAQTQLSTTTTPYGYPY